DDERGEDRLVDVAVHQDGAARPGDGEHGAVDGDAGATGGEDGVPGAHRVGVALFRLRYRPFGADRVGGEGAAGEHLGGPVVDAPAEPVAGQGEAVGALPPEPLD